MINQNEAIDAFKKKLESMTLEEREAYLKEKGFVFTCGEDEKIEDKRK